MGRLALRGTRQQTRYAMTRSISTLAALIVAVPLAAQAPGEHDGHTQQLGRVRFATSCHAAARTEVERGVAYLHSFWYEKAAETFAAAAAADSGCAMAFWGQAMSLLHPLWTPPPSADARAALGVIDRGLARAKTTRERGYLDAIRAYYADYDRTDPKARLVRYALAMDSVRRRSPSDTEAAIFYALALIAVGQANATDTTFTYQKRADSILEPLFRREPRHPGLAHYLIHTNDVPQLAAHGLYAARRYAEIAPDVPHAQHMPSHIFTRLGAWDDAIASNTRSAAAARAYEVERGLTAMWDQRTHALDYLTYAYLQQGRDTAARRVAAEAAAAPAGFPAGSLPHEYAGAAIPARVALERSAWDEAARLAVHSAPEWPAAEGITHFARAIGAARGNDSAAARPGARGRPTPIGREAHRGRAGLCGDAGALAQPRPQPVRPGARRRAHGRHGHRSREVSRVPGPHGQGRWRAARGRDRPPRRGEPVAGRDNHVKYRRTACVGSPQSPS